MRRIKMNKVPPAPGLLTPKSGVVLPHTIRSTTTPQPMHLVFLYSTSFIFFILLIVSSLV